MQEFFQDAEVKLAELWELLAERELGIIPGPRSRKDVTDGTDLRVDFVYEEATPEPVALEVTSIPLGELRAAHRAGDRWSAQLDDTVKSERLGTWVVHFSAHSNIRDLSDEILEILRSQPRAGTIRDPRDRFTLMRRESQEDEQNGVYFMGVSTKAFSISGFSRDLLGATLSNAAKLGETRPRRTHLIVNVGLHKSLDPTKTLVPPSPIQAPPLAAIDWIWITFHTDPKGFSDREWIWWAQPGDEEWKTHSGQLL